VEGSQEEFEEDTRPIAMQGRRAPPGSAPGTLVPDPEAPKATIRLIAYGPHDLVERFVENLEEVDALLDRLPVVWIDVIGLGDTATIQRIGEHFNLHRLTLEDVVNVHQRPKFESYDDYGFIVTRILRHDQALETDQMGIFLGKGFVITFHERDNTCFEPILARMRSRRGRIRDSRADYLAYALIDAVTDAFFPVLEVFGERVAQLEDEITVGYCDDHQMAEIHHLKRDLMTVRRVVWSQREMINALIRDPGSLVEERTDIYLRDCYDHAVQALDVIETYRDISSSLVEIYFASLSRRMNEVMRVLTMIATIFIPLSFIASVYGMNFSTDVSPFNMPELHWYWGYPAALGLMASVAFILLYFFWRRGWIGDSARRRAVRRAAAVEEDG